VIFYESEKILERAEYKNIRNVPGKNVSRFCGVNKISTHTNTHNL
jgi:hypothetical protein